MFDWIKLTNIVHEAVRQSFLAVFFTMIKELSEKGSEKENYRDKTIKKLKAYPILQNNIKEYEKDLEDIYKEEFGSSPAVHIAQGYYCSDLTIDEIRRAEALKIEVKIERDMRIIKEMDRALAEIKDDYYAPIIKSIYFDKLEADDIAQTLHCDRATVYRNKNRLLNILAIKLYGGDVLN